MDRRLISAILVVLIASLVGGEETGVKDEQVVVEEVRKWGLEREVEEKLVWWIEWMMKEGEEKLKIRKYSKWLWKNEKNCHYLIQRVKIEEKRGSITFNIFPRFHEHIKGVVFLVTVNKYDKDEGKLWGGFTVWFPIPPEGVVPEDLRVAIDGVRLPWWGEEGDGEFKGTYGTSVRGVAPPKELEVGDLRIPLYWEEFWDGE